MINLAGNKDADKYVERELRRARLFAFPLEGAAGEVPTTLMGRLADLRIGGNGQLTFTRAWTYWVVKGLVPLDLAWRLFLDPVGRDDVRVNGHCGKPAPNGHYVRWLAADRREIALQADLDEARKFKIEGYLERFERDYAIARDAEERERIGTPFIDGYHIDTEVGLRLFVDTVTGR